MGRSISFHASSLFFMVPNDKWATDLNLARTSWSDAPKAWFIVQRTGCRFSSQFSPAACRMHTQPDNNRKQITVLSKTGISLPWCWIDDTLLLELGRKLKRLEAAARLNWQKRPGPTSYLWHSWLEGDYELLSRALGHQHYRKCMKWLALVFKARLFDRTSSDSKLSVFWGSHF